MNRLILTVALLAGSFGLAGCETEPSTADMEPNLDIRASHTKILAGETVTFTSETENFYGSNAEVRWSASGGDLDMEQGNRVARVEFDQPGTYIVTAELLVDGNRVDTASQTIEVRPVR